MNYNLIAYLIYLPICIGLCILVGKNLHRHGKVLLEKTFSDSRLANSMNQLLLTGFYLLIIGYVTIYMPMRTELLSVEHLIEKLSYKLGILLISLGFLHFINLLSLYRIGRNRLNKRLSM